MNRAIKFTSVFAGAFAGAISPQVSSGHWPDLSHIAAGLVLGAFSVFCYLLTPPHGSTPCAAPTLPKGKTNMADTLKLTFVVNGTPFHEEQDYPLPATVASGIDIARSAFKALGQDLPTISVQAELVQS